MERLGREVRVFETRTRSTNPETEPSSDGGVAGEEDDFYQFTADDYYRVFASKKEDKHMKTKKMRDAEEAARRSKITKAVIRVRFPDNHTLEATFHPSETIQSLLDLLMKAVSNPELPFYIYTTPPKKQVRDTCIDFFSAGFVPGAIVYFSPASSAGQGPYLREDIMSLKAEAAVVNDNKAPVLEPITSLPDPPPPVQNKAVDKKPTRPKWFKL